MNLYMVIPPVEIFKERITVFINRWTKLITRAIITFWLFSTYFVLELLLFESGSSSRLLERFFDLMISINVLTQRFLKSIKVYICFNWIYVLMTLCDIKLGCEFPVWDGYSDIRRTRLLANLTKPVTTSPVLHGTVKNNLKSCFLIL